MTDAVDSDGEICLLLFGLEKAAKRYIIDLAKLDETPYAEFREQWKAEPVLSEELKVKYPDNYVYLDPTVDSLGTRWRICALPG